MGGNPAAKGNTIAQASLDESRRQYNEQQERERTQKAKARANAVSVRESDVTAYANNLQQTTNMNASTQQNYSLISTSVGTPSVLNTLMGGNNQVDTLGG